MILNGQPFTIERHGLDKYGRTLAIICSNGQDVGEMLIKERLARSWPDGDEFWCK
jgi:micrococcal nuclease